VPGAWDPYEIGVRIIIGQQVSVAGARTVAGRLVAELGAAVPGLEPLGLGRAFPPADVLATADLSGVGLTRTRGRAVQAFAAAVAEDRLPLDGRASLDDLVGAITDLPGVGPWTAHHLALRIGERDAFPVTDLGLVRAYQRLAPEAAEPLDVRAERWSPWRSTAATHLWAAAGDPSSDGGDPLTATATGPTVPSRRGAQR
jgi:AraC family transcriptional regulator of adaptative response / DNA-3-methyladenine glycosylase II